MTHRVKGGERGQLPFVPTKEDRALVAILAGNGIPHKAVCKYVKNPVTKEPIGLATLKRHFVEELEDGRSEANALLIQWAFAQAKDTPSTLIFLLKTRLGWKEPAQDVNLHQTYGELVEAAAKVKEKPALVVVQGGKA